MEKLSSLVCAITRCDNTQCTGDAPFVDISAVLDIVERLLQGPTEEVTNTVRQRTYRILAHSIKHHRDETGPAEWNRTGQVITKGVIDKDRSVRLASG